jgi:hypothetical protein
MNLRARRHRSARARGREGDSEERSEVHDGYAVTCISCRIHKNSLRTTQPIHVQILKIHHVHVLGMDSYAQEKQKWKKYIVPTKSKQSRARPTIRSVTTELHKKPTRINNRQQASIPLPSPASFSHPPANAHNSERSDNRTRDGPKRCR